MPGTVLEAENRAKNKTDIPFFFQKLFPENCRLFWKLGINSERKAKPLLSRSSHPSGMEIDNQCVPKHRAQRMPVVPNEKITRVMCKVL